MTHSGRALFGERAGTLALRLVGEIRYTIAQDLEPALEKALKRADFDTLIVDLRETKLIDSTALGLLARLGRFMLSQRGRRGVIVCPAGDVDTSLRAVCFDEVFVMLRESPEEVDAIHEIPVDNGNNGPHRSLGRVMLDAHRELMAVSAKNEATFRNVVRALEAEVVRKEATAIKK